MSDSASKTANTNSPSGVGGMEYNFREIEKKWQKQWNAEGAYKVSNESSKPKYYVLDMFPYPSGAGLHVGHPLGYIASDIVARYKRLKGFNVLHPMGYDAFGLPAEQYALEHGVHPAVSTAQNIKNFRAQLDKIGFSFDWDREVNTSDPRYYKWTQWIFLQLFKAWYNRHTNRTEPIDTLIAIFESEGNKNHPIPNTQFQIVAIQSLIFTADEWAAFDHQVQQTILMEYRIAYCGYGEVNWCEALGTVLANDEVVNGVSERGGYPVVKKKLRQWYLRITEYADRLLEGLQKVDYSEAMKEMQTNWIGKSSGAEITFHLTPNPSPKERGAESSTHGYVTSSVTQWKALIDQAKENRKAPTEAEEKLWQALRNRQIVDQKFRRQHPIEGYIPDFVCIEKRLVIEVDGEYHNEAEQQAYDEARTAFLKEYGYELIRFTNEKVLNDLPNVLKQITNALNDRSPLLGRGAGGEVLTLTVYTTRPDTIFGVDFMVIAPEHELVEQITPAEHKGAVEEYIAYVKSRSERERMAEKKISGVFTGAYAVNPFDETIKIPIWISEYVLAGYGTGAIMAVPCGDERDHKFAQHFNLPITNIIGDYYNGEEANPTKEAILQNSGFLNGIKMRDAMEVVINKIEELGIGKRKVNFKIRDAAFSRQRYWGEPFPIVWRNGVAYPQDESTLPLELPHVESYQPGPEGEGPLANIPEWTERHLETNTMPGYAGSSWYFLRYMDPQNEELFCSKQASDYWNQVDLYVGGTEHAVGHLLYSRMWTKALFDLGYISHDEPYKKLLNQGMIQGASRFVYRLDVFDNTKDTLSGVEKKTSDPIFVSRHFYSLPLDESIKEIHSILKEHHSSYQHLDQLASRINVGLSDIHVDVNIVDGVELDIKAFRKWRPEFKEAILILEDGSISLPTGEGRGGAYICGSEVEKMSKSKFNTVNPDVLVEKYGADTFRMYEMFLGPVEMSKPWDTKGIEGVHRFLKKLWRLFADEQKGLVVTADAPTNDEWKVLHKTIKKVEEDTERFSFNTVVSAFMVCVNELGDLKCHKRQILEPVLILLTPYAPHISEELWHLLGNETSILDAAFPKFEQKYLVETVKEYPISINGKMRTQINIDLSADQKQVEEIVLSNAIVQKWVEGKQPKKIIYVKGKMVNVVI